MQGQQQPVLLKPSARHTQVRGVEKAHARLGREANKAADDMRTRRMEALKVGGASAAERATLRVDDAQHGAYMSSTNVV